MEGLGHLRKHLGEVPMTGPMAIYHGTGRPWEASRFRRKWREIARARKIPDTFQNRDSRAGAITEARDLGADMEKARDAATHSNIATTERYSRMRAKNATVIEVQKIRLAARNKPQTGND